MKFQGQYQKLKTLQAKTRRTRLTVEALLNTIDTLQACELTPEQNLQETVTLEVQIDRLERGDV